MPAHDIFRDSIAEISIFERKFLTDLIFGWNGPSKIGLLLPYDWHVACLSKWSQAVIAWQHPEVINGI